MRDAWPRQYWPSSQPAAGRVLAPVRHPFYDRDMACEGAARAGRSLAVVLFTDLVGSTQLRSRLGEEAAEELRRSHDRLLADAVETHGGRVVKGLGDGIMASFGGAADAVVAAVAIQQAIDRLNRSGKAPVPLSVRVGLSAGDAAFEDDDVHGTPVIEASRLCAAASGGQILAADLVRLLVRGGGDLTFLPLQDLELKGLPAPVSVVEVPWEPSGGVEVPFPPLLSSGGFFRFAGRAAELELLDRVWKTAVGGERRAVLIAGEPGLGKTRLAAEFARQVHDGGGIVLYGRCDENLGVPYAPFVEALGWYSEHVAAAELRPRLGRFPGELVRLVPELAHVMPRLDPPLQSDPETEQYRLFEAVASWLTCAGDPGGVLLVVDDLHWAAVPTLGLLAHVVRGGGPAPLLVVATFRDTEIVHGHALAPLLAGLRRAPGVERVSLAGLTVDELAEFLEGVPESDHRRALAVALYEETDGNPFFAGEVLRQRAESGQSFAALPTPESVREVIVARVARLSDLTRELLHVGSVFGRTAHLSPLATVAGVEEDTAVEALDEALAARLLEETGPGVYRFAHALVRSALYESLSTSRRARLHLRAATIYERAGDEASLAHHLVAALPLSSSTTTGTACRAAGDRALAVFADAEATKWYETGIDALGDDQDDPGLSIDLRTGLGEAQRRTGDAAFRDTLIDAARRAADHGDILRLVRAVLANNRGFTSVMGKVDEERIEWIETAIEALGPAPTAQRADLLSLLAAELAFGPEYERRLATADEAAAIATAVGDPALKARVDTRRLIPCLVPDRVLALADECADIVAMADATSDPLLEVVARVFSIGPLGQAGKLAESRRMSAEALTIADDTAQPSLRAYARFLHGATIDALGEHGEGATLAQSALDLGQEAGMPDALMWYAGRMWLHWTFEGQAETAAAVAAQAYAEYPLMVGWQAGRAFSLSLAGRDDELTPVIASLADILPGAVVDMFWLVSHFYTALVLSARNEDQALARLIYERLLPYRPLHATYLVGYLGPVEIALGACARILGNIDTALAHHDAAAAMIEACGATRARALNSYLWALAFLDDSTPEARDRGVELLHEAQKQSETYGYATLQHAVERALAETRRA
jgi:class 3 adenylate cyclase